MNEYIRFLLKTMQTKYHMSMPSFARGIGKRRLYMNQFVAGTRNARMDNLKLIESELIDLYEPLLDIEMQIHKIYLDDLFERGKIQKKLKIKKGKTKGDPDKITLTAVINQK